MRNVSSKNSSESCCPGITRLKISCPWWTSIKSSLPQCETGSHSLSLEGKPPSGVKFKPNPSLFIHLIVFENPPAATIKCIRVSDASDGFYSRAPQRAKQRKQNKIKKPPRLWLFIQPRTDKWLGGHMTGLTMRFMQASLSTVSWSVPL